jgi:hypothetical protein
VEDPPLLRDHRERTGAFNGSVDIFSSHLRSFQRHDTLAVFGRDVAAGDAGVHGVDLNSRHQLCFFDGLLDGFNGAFNVDNDSFTQAA